MPHRMNHRPIHLTVCFAIFLSISSASADTVHYDVLLTGSSGSLITGGYDDGTNAGIAPMRVFVGEAVSSSGSPAMSDDEPGFRAPNQTFLDSAAMTPNAVFSALPSNTALLFRLVPMTISGTDRNLFYWNGTGAVNFGPLSSGYGLSLTGDFGSTSITGASSSPTSEFVLKTTSPDGSLDPGHPHFTTTIGNAGATPAQGFYLFSMQFSISGLSASAPAYFVYGVYDFDSPPVFEEFDLARHEAETWVENNLVAVPEPSSIALAGLGVAGLVGAALRRRMRKQ
jgi:hypothetical protein